MPRMASKGCGVRGVVAELSAGMRTEQGHVAQRPTGMRTEQGEVNALKSPFTARRTIFAERTGNPPDSPSVPRMAAKKAGSGKPPPAHSGSKQNRKYPSRESIRTGPTTENRERMTDGPADTTAGTLKHGPGHGKDQCFTLPRASGLCLYLKTIAKTTPTTRA